MFYNTMFVIFSLKVELSFFMFQAEATKKAQEAAIALALAQAMAMATADPEPEAQAPAPNISGYEDVENPAPESDQVVAEGTAMEAQPEGTAVEAQAQVDDVTEALNALHRDGQLTEEELFLVLDSIYDADSIEESPVGKAYAVFHKTPAMFGRKVRSILKKVGSKGD